MNNAISREVSRKPGKSALYRSKRYLKDHKNHQEQEALLGHAASSSHMKKKRLKSFSGKGIPERSFEI